MKSIYFVLVAICLSVSVNGQIAINTDGSSPHPNAILDVKSDSKGMLVPRMTTVQREMITSPTGLLVFDTDSNSFWFRDDANWVELVSGKISSLEDADGDTKIDVEKNEDEDKIRFTIGGNKQMLLQKAGVETGTGNRRCFLRRDV